MKRYNIYSYLDYDTPSGEPHDGWENRPEEDGVFVYFDEAYEIQEERDAARARVAELEGLLRRAEPCIDHTGMEAELRGISSATVEQLRKDIDAALAAGKGTK